MNIRNATTMDITEITRIYNFYVLNSHATFDTDSFRPEERQNWFDGYADHGSCQLIVAEDGDKLAGYACSSKLKLRKAYDSSVETTVYVDPDVTGRGTGRKLYTELFAQLADVEALHRAYGGIALPNESSVALHERFGFKRVGLYNEVGLKFGKYWDVAWYEKDLDV